ncbi:hypothetical protein ACO0QE_003727 [Hanseniaspora vineae]
MNLSAQQKASIEANRKRALERLQKRGISIPSSSKLHETSSKVTKPSHQNGTGSSIQATKVIESTAVSGSINPPQQPSSTINTDSHPQNRDASSVEPKKQYIRPSIRRKDYIEYDFSTMENSYGGFINNDRSLYGSGYSSIGNTEKTFEQWQAEQRSKNDLFNGPSSFTTETGDAAENGVQPVREFKHLGPDIISDLSSLPKCEECHVNVEFDTILLQHFKIKICKRCTVEHPEKYSLLTKTECKSDYLLTEPELEDRKLFHRLEKANPHSGTFARMQLFLRKEVEEFAFKKWGGQDGLDKEWEQREASKLERREKKYQLKLKEMRKKTRAQEYTEKMKMKKFGAKHVHEFSAPLKMKKKSDDGYDVVKRRCIGCGMEVEELDI